MSRFTATWRWPAGGQGVARSVAWEDGRLSGDPVLVARITVAAAERIGQPEWLDRYRPGRDPLANEASARAFLRRVFPVRPTFSAG